MIRINSLIPAENGKQFLLEQARQNKFIPVGARTLAIQSTDVQFKKEFGLLYLQHLRTSYDSANSRDKPRQQEIITSLIKMLSGLGVSVASVDL